MSPVCRRSRSSRRSTSRCRAPVRRRSPSRPAGPPCSWRRFRAAWSPGGSWPLQLAVAGAGFFGLRIVLLPSRVVGLVTSSARPVRHRGLGYAGASPGYAAYYFDNAPELMPYLLSVEPERRLRVQGLTGGYFQVFRTIAGMVAVIAAGTGGIRGGPRRDRGDRGPRRPQRLRRAEWRPSVPSSQC